MRPRELGWTPWIDSCDRITISVRQHCSRFFRIFRRAGTGRVRLGAESITGSHLPSAWSRRLDDIVLHKLWGPLIFVIVVGAVFQTVFGLGQPMSTAFQDLLTKFGQQAAPLVPDGLLRSLLLDGLWKGVSSVLVFLPQILLLFLFIGLLEDSGYLARAALIADRTMRSVGLNGKAFIPLLSAYACAVPAIMATRTIENKRDRIATILVAPFMTCSARLPIYTLLIAAFIPDRPVVGVLLGSRACAMLSLYLLGFLAAISDGETPEVVGAPVFSRSVRAGTSRVSVADISVDRSPLAGSRHASSCGRRARSFWRSLCWFGS